MKLLFALSAILVSMCQSIHAGILAQHTGNIDPATEGWELYNSSGGFVSGGIETTGSGTYSYWQVAHPYSTTVPNHYRHSLDELQLQGDWYLASILRIVDSRPHEWGNNYLPFGMLSVRDNYSTWGLMFGNAEVGIMDSTIQFSRSLSIDPRTDYHLYEIYFHQNGDGFADDTADFYMDNAPIFEGVTRSEVQSISSVYRGVWMGAGSSGAYTIMNFGSIALFDAAPVVPEPAAALLLVVGLLMAAFRRKKEVT